MLYRGIVVHGVGGRRRPVLRLDRRPRRVGELSLMFAGVDASQVSQDAAAA